MAPPTIHVPMDPGVLYHYSSTSAFHAIISSKTVRVSSLSLSNDTSEGKLVANVFSRLAEKDSLAPALAARLRESLGILEQIIDGLGFCLSEEGDLLSQWRGYADDGAGVSIGFSNKYFAGLAELLRERKEYSFSLQQVVYDPTEHEKMLEPTYREVRELIDDGAFKISGIRGLLDTRTEEEVEAEDKKVKSKYMALHMKILPLIFQAFRLKSHAFVEEQEWRVLAYLTKTAGDVPDFHASKDRLTPFRAFPLESTATPPLVRVVLGPKHLTPIDMVRRFLDANGFSDVPVERSAASYR